MKKDAAPTVWIKFACGKARWTATAKGIEQGFNDDDSGRVCDGSIFSGCNCGEIVRRVGETTERGEAALWFRSP